MDTGSSEPQMSDRKGCVWRTQTSKSWTDEEHKNILLMHEHYFSLNRKCKHIHFILNEEQKHPQRNKAWWTMKGLSFSSLHLSYTHTNVVISPTKRELNRETTQGERCWLQVCLISEPSPLLFIGGEGHKGSPRAPRECTEVPMR
jgi:hypothetical protein